MNQRAAQEHEEGTAEDDKVVDMVDTEQRMDEHKSCAFHWDSATPEISVLGVEILRVESHGQRTRIRQKTRPYHVTRAWQTE